jgi:hypothetical protein
MLCTWNAGYSCTQRHRNLKVTWESKTLGILRHWFHFRYSKTSLRRLAVWFFAQVSSVGVLPAFQQMVWKHEFVLPNVTDQTAVIKVGNGQFSVVTRQNGWHTTLSLPTLSHKLILPLQSKNSQRCQVRVCCDDLGNISHVVALMVVFPVPFYLFLHYRQLLLLLADSPPSHSSDLNRVGRWSLRDMSAGRH